MGDGQRQDIHNSDLPLVCRACEARHKGICGALSPEQLTELNKHASRTAHETTVELHSSDFEQDHYSNILGGVVKLTKNMPDGRQQIVGLQFAPDFMGRPFSSQRNVVAETATNVRLCSFPRKVLDKFMSESPEMERLLHKQHLNELDEAREWMLTLGRKTAIEKVASFLLLIATHINPEREDGSTEISIEVPLKRADIADFLGLTIETVSRQLTNLRKKGIIEIGERRVIVIASLPKLALASGSG